MRADSIPDCSEDQRCRQCTKPDREIVPPERCASTRLRNQVGHECLLGSLSECVEETVRCKQSPCMPFRCCDSESEIHHCIDGPPCDDPVSYTHLTLPTSDL